MAKWTWKQTPSIILILVIVTLWHQHFFIIPFQRILLLMSLLWYRSFMATIAQECACPTVCGEQSQLSLRNVPAVALVTHVCSLWGCPCFSLPPFLTRAHLQLYPQQYSHLCVYSSSYSLVSLPVSFLPWQLSISRGTTCSSLLIKLWWVLGCFHPFQSCLELAVAGSSWPHPTLGTLQLLLPIPTSYVWYLWGRFFLLSSHSQNFWKFQRYSTWKLPSHES